jgi:chaperonin GroEL
MNPQPVKSYENMRLKKSVLFAEQARGEIHTGIHLLASTVKGTLGPLGGAVVVECLGESPWLTRDGLAASARLTLASPHHNLGVQLLRQAATATQETAGDGATTAVVLAQAIVNEGLRNIAAGANPVFFRQGLLKGAAIARLALGKLSRPLAGMAEMLSVATLASGDAEIGALVCHVATTLGKDGVIWMHDHEGVDLAVELAQGMSWKQGYLSANFITHPNTGEAILENASVLVADATLSQAHEIVPILEQLVCAAPGGERLPGAPRLLVIADAVVGNALATLVVNHQQGKVKSLVVKPPVFDAQRRAILSDIAVLTGATLFDAGVGRPIQKATLNDLGQVEWAIATHNRTTLTGSNGSPAAIEARVREIRTLMANTGDKAAQDKLQQRLAGLVGGFATIRVGGYTDAHRKERGRLLRKAYSSVRSAVAEGVLPGGGIALLNIIPTLAAAKPVTAEEAAALCCLQRAFEAPFRQLAANAGQDAGAILAVVQRRQQVTRNPFIGYDVLRQACGDLCEWGVLDPTPVVRTAMLNAISAASQILTIETSIGVIPGQPISLAEPPSETLLRLRAERKERKERYRRLGRQKPPKRVW